LLRRKKKEKKHWRDYFDGPVELSDDMKAAKKLKTDGKAETEVKFEDIVNKQVEKIGSVDPVTDFKQMISRRDDAKWINKAIGDMIEMIKDLVKTSYGATNFPKAIDCIGALRIGCVQMEEAGQFNSALIDFKNLFQKKKESFWKLVVEKSILPIDTSEVPDSKFTPSQAKGFHAGDPSASASTSVAEVPSDGVWDSLE